MSKCAHCRKQNGKRSCPALKSKLCDACCDNHRGRDIKCPWDCCYNVEPAKSPATKT